MWRNKVVYILSLIVVMCVLFPAPHGTVAQDTATPAPQPTLQPTPRPVSDNEVNRVSRGLYCPVCQNVPLEVCETTACQRWREQVRDLLAQGYTEQQVREYFVDRFGAQTVGVPTNPIAQVLTVVLPLTLIVMLGGLAAYNVIQWRRGNAVVQSEMSQPSDNPIDNNIDNDIDDNYRARIESELKERE